MKINRRLRGIHKLTSHFFTQVIRHFPPNMDQAYVGKLFSSVEELEEFSRAYTQQTNRKLNRQGSHLTPNNPVLKYHSLSLQCESFGAPRMKEITSKKGRPSKKCHCPFVLKISLSKEKTHLVINENSVLHHNQACQNRDAGKCLSLFN